MWLMAVVVVSGCVSEDPGEGAAIIGVGDPCPVFELEMADGSVVATSDFSGRRVMLVFFNTACEDCRRELPVIQRVAESLAGETEAGLPRIICVSRNEPEASVAKYWRANGLTLPYSASGDDRVYRLFADAVIPRVYIIGEDLKIEAAYAETLPSAEELELLMRPDGASAWGAGQ